MNSVLEAIYRDGQVTAADGRIIPLGRSGITYASGSLLYDLVRRHKPMRSLEVGLAYGLSALFVCQAHADNALGGSHVAVDPDETRRWEGIGVLNLERAGLGDRLTLHEGPSYAILPELVNAGESFDFAFIDGNHLFDFALVDFFYIDLMLSENGLVVFDDMWMPAIQKAVAYVLTNRTYALLPTPAGHRPDVKTRWKTALTRLRRSPLDFHRPLVSLPTNLAVLRKLRHDDRDWEHHRRF